MALLLADNCPGHDVLLTRLEAAAADNCPGLAHWRSLRSLGAVVLDLHT